MSNSESSHPSPSSSLWSSALSTLRGVAASAPSAALAARSTPALSSALIAGRYRRTILYDGPEESVAAAPAASGGVGVVDSASSVLLSPASGLEAEVEAFQRELSLVPESRKAKSWKESMAMPAVVTLGFLGILAVAVLRQPANKPLNRKLVEGRLVAQSAVIAALVGAAAVGIMQDVKRTGS